MLRTPAMGLHALSPMSGVLLLLRSQLFAWVRFAYDISGCFLLKKTVQRLGSGMILRKNYATTVLTIMIVESPILEDLDPL
jgi:hypothetical protein